MNRNLALSLVFLLTVAALHALPTPAAAHMFMTYQTDHDSTVRVAPREVVVTYRLTHSELAAVEELQYINADGDTEVTRRRSTPL